MDWRVPTCSITAYSFAYSVPQSTQHDGLGGTRWEKHLQEHLGGGAVDKAVGEGMAQIAQAAVAEEQMQEGQVGEAGIAVAGVRRGVGAHLHEGAARELEVDAVAVEAQAQAAV